MVEAAVKEQILNDLERLSPGRLEEFAATCTVLPTDDQTARFMG